PDDRGAHPGPRRPRSLCATKGAEIIRNPADRFIDGVPGAAKRPVGNPASISASHARLLKGGVEARALNATSEIAMRTDGRRQARRLVLDFAGAQRNWRAQRESNPCFRRERAWILS